MVNELKQLQTGLSLCVLKKDAPRTATTAYSVSGKHYLAGYVESDTHLLYTSSEQVALMLATQSSDYQINRLVTIQESIDPAELVSPITLKIIVDFARRTGQPIAYTVLDTSGVEVFHADDVNTILSFYAPVTHVLGKVTDAVITTNKTKAVGDKPKQLKEQALKGVARSFPTYDSASGYGAAVITADGSMYHSGQYSSFEHRTNVHSEMGAVIAAIMNGQTQITDIGLVSTKYTDKPCQMCGSCRQFLAEMSTRFNLDLDIHLFAFSSNQHESHKLDSYLPKSWTSKRW
ncbi:MAG: hypothetical protein ACR2FM_01360 [Candidatus Saccharimonadales bacterium]